MTFSELSDPDIIHRVILIIRNDAIYYFHEIAGAAILSTHFRLEDNIKLTDCENLQFLIMVIYMRDVENTVLCRSIYALQMYNKPNKNILKSY